MRRVTPVPQHVLRLSFRFPTGVTTDEERVLALELENTAFLVGDSSEGVTGWCTLGGGKAGGQTDRHYHRNAGSQEPEHMPTLTGIQAQKVNQLSTSRPRIKRTESPGDSREMRFLPRVLPVVVLLAFPTLALGAPGQGAYAPGQLLVKFQPGTEGTAITTDVRAAGATQRRAIPRLGVRVVSVPAADAAVALRRLRNDPDIVYAERDALFTAAAAPNDYWWPSEWAPPKVGAPTAWGLTTGSAQTKIAVLDSGVDFSQPDLQGAFVPGRDIVNSDEDPSDDYGHGTEVAGVAAARSNNLIGVTSYCWSCAIMPVKVLDSTGSGTASNVASGIVWATDHGARVINLSLGSTTSSSTVASAAQYAHEHGAVLVAAAGNSSSTTPNYPAALPTVLGVAGTDSTDQLTSTSNYGSWVKLAAPGCNFTTGLNGWYGTFCGTSSASPVVAGIAGLAFSLKPGATNAEVEAALESSAVPESFVQYGRVDAGATLSALGGGSGGTSEPPAGTPEEETAPAPNATTTFSGSVSAKQPSRSFSLAVGSGTATATLTFTKASALTLTLLAPDGSAVGTVKGASGLTLTEPVSPGTYRYAVKGEALKGSASFTLTVSYPPA